MLKVGVLEVCCAVVKGCGGVLGCRLGLWRCVVLKVRVVVVCCAEGWCFGGVLCCS